MQQELNQRTKVGNLEVRANAQKGEVWVTGFSDYSNLNKIFENLRTWLKLYYQNPKEITKFHFRISCISKTLDKSIFSLLSSIKKSYTDKSKNEVFWHYFEDDDDDEILEIGQEYSEIFELPFHLIEEDEDEFKQRELDLINKKVSENKLDKAFNLYSDYLRNNFEKWKIPITKKVYEAAKQIKTPVVFTARHADMLLLNEIDNGEAENSDFTIYMIHIIQASSDLKTNKEKFNFIANSRINTENAIKEVLTETLKVEVKGIIISNEIEKSFIEHNSLEYNTDLFTYTDFKNFDLNTILQKNNLTSVKSSFYDFAVKLASYLVLNCDDIPSSYSINNSFDILDLAPDSFNTFVQNLNSVRERNSNNQDVFSLSLNAAFVSENTTNVIELAIHLNHNVFPGEDDRPSSIEVEKYNFSAIEREDDFKSFLSNQVNNIIVIENIEKDLKAEKNQIAGPTKDELIAYFCDYLESCTTNMFILSVSKTGWEQLIVQYPLLRVCFQHIFHFKNYSPEILKRRFATELELLKLIAEDSAIELAEEYFRYQEREIDSSLFNSTIATMLAREVRYYQILRIGNARSEDNIIVKEDVYNSIKDEYNQTSKKDLSVIMSELDRLTGLANVKASIKDLAALVKIQKLRSKDDELVSLNSIFLGNPGTGKTTVAGILGEIYKNIGVLSKGHVVSVKRHDIVEQYIGYTARNMKQLLDRARGGILFIDEAYSLFRPDNDRDFGIEAIDTLVAELENIKETTCVIMAGYPDKMKSFLDSNPGLASRFPNITEFDDYTAIELNEILTNFISRAKYELEEEGANILANFIRSIVKTKDSYFGNARECRNIFEKLKLIHASRIIYNEQIENSDLNTFILADVQKLIETYKIKEKEKEERVVIGFRNTQ